MKRKTINRKLILVLAVFLLLLLTGCKSIIGTDGQVLKEKIIYLDTTWSSIRKTDGLFTFIFVYPLAQAINFLSQYMNVAIAITLVTVIINLILMKISIKSTVGMQKMQMLQPEMQKIQDKYAGRNDDQAKIMQANELNALYKKYDINPIGSIIGPFAQLPILFSMYYAVQRANAVVTGTIAGVALTNSPIAGVKMGGAGIILFVIYILMGIFQFVSTSIPKWLAKAAEKKDHRVKQYAKTKEPPANSMTTYFMVILIMVMAANWPSAMSLYWLISSVVTVIKTIYIQKRYIENA